MPDDLQRQISELSTNMARLSEATQRLLVELTRTQTIMSDYPKVIEKVNDMYGIVMRDFPDVERRVDEHERILAKGLAAKSGKDSAWGIVWKLGVAVYGAVGTTALIVQIVHH